MINKINDVVSLKKFRPVIEIKGVRDEEKEQLFKEYIITEEIVENLERIFEHITLSVSDGRREKGIDINTAEINRAFLLRGAYGTGKSYFLLTLGTILENISMGHGEKVREKFAGFEGLEHHIDKLIEIGESYFIVNINGVAETNIEFEDAIRKNFILKCKEHFNGEEYIPGSSFEHAIEKLKGDKNHSLRWQLIAEQMERKNIDYNSLMSGLKKYKRDSLLLYQDLQEDAFGNPPDIYGANFDVFIKESSDYIQSKGYKGVIFLFDEFSAYLTSVMEDGRINTNLSKASELAEACHFSTGNNILFVAAIHKSLSILLGNVILEREELEKISERFEEIPISFSEGNELIKDAIKVDKNRYQIMKSEFDEVTKLDNLTKGLLRDYYPIHPSTIGYLNTLSRIYAQENRTLFRFLSDVVARKINTEDIMREGKLNLVTVDYLFDYFIGRISDDNIGFSASVNDTLRYCKEEWQEEIVKALAVARMAVYDYRAGSGVKIGLTINELSEYLLIRDKTVIEAFLLDLSHKPRVNIYHDKANDTYEFMESAVDKIDIEKEKERIRPKINEYRELKGLIMSKGRHRRNYNTKIDIEPLIGITPVAREFSGQIYTYNDLIKAMEKNRRLDIAGDGNIIHILPQYFEVDKIDENLIKNQLSKYGANVVVVVPKNYDFNREHIIEYGIYKKLFNDEKYVDNNKLREYISKEKEKYEQILIQKIDEYTSPKNFKYIFNDSILEFDNFNRLSNHMLKNHYTKFPAIESPIKSRALTNQIIRTFIVPGEKTIPKGSSSEENRHIQDTLKAIGLASTKVIVGDDIKAELTMPIRTENPKSHEIFDIVCNEDKREVFKILEAAPYGLPEFIIELYIASARALGKIYILEGEKNLHLTVELIANIKRKGNIRFVKPKDNISLDDLLYVKDFWKVVGGKIGSRGYDDFHPEKETNMVKAMLDMRKDISLFHTQLENNIRLLSDRNLRINLMVKLKKSLGELDNAITPEDYFEAINKLPISVMEEKNKGKALKKLEDSIDKFNIIVSKIQLYTNALNSCNHIHGNRERFEENSKVVKLADKVIELGNKIREKPLEFDNIGELDKLVKDFFSLFNGLYKENHKKMHDSISSIKSDMALKPHVELIEALERFKFEDIATIKELYGSIQTSYPYCNNDFTTCLSNELYHCTCMEEDSKLGDFELKLNDFEEEIEQAEKTSIGVIDNYRKAFLEISNTKTKDKKDLREFIRDRGENLYSIYEDFMFYITDNPIENRKFLIENSENLSDIIDQYRKYIKMKPVKEKPGVPMDKVSAKIVEGIKLSGKSRLNKEEFVSIVEKVIEDEVGDKFILVRQAE